MRVDDVLGDHGLVGGGDKWCLDIEHEYLPISNEILLGNRLVYKNILQLEDKLYTVLLNESTNRFELSILSSDFEIISTVGSYNTQFGYDRLSIDSVNRRLLYSYDVSNTRRIYVLPIDSFGNIDNSKAKFGTVYNSLIEAPYTIGDNVLGIGNSYSNTKVQHKLITDTIQDIQDATLLFTPKGGFIDDGVLVLSTKEKANEDRYLRYINISQSEVSVEKALKLPSEPFIDKNGQLQYIKDNDYLYLMLSDYRIIVISRDTREIIKIGNILLDPQEPYDNTPYFIGNSIIKGKILLGGLYGVKFVDPNTLTVVNERYIIPKFRTTGWSGGSLQLTNTVSHAGAGSPMIYFNKDKSIFSTMSYRYLINSSGYTSSYKSEFKSPLYY